MIKGKHSMEVKDLQQKKKDLERAIKASIDGFIADTGIDDIHIDLERIRYINTPSSYYVHVTVWL